MLVSSFLLGIFLFFLQVSLYPCFLTIKPMALACAEQADFPSAERFNYLLDVLKTGYTNEEKVRHISTNYGDKDRYDFLLLSSPPLRKQHMLRVLFFESLLGIAFNKA